MPANSAARQSSYSPNYMLPKFMPPDFITYKVAPSASFVAQGLKSFTSTLPRQAARRSFMLVSYPFSNFKKYFLTPLFLLSLQRGYFDDVVGVSTLICDLNHSQPLFFSLAFSSRAEFVHMAGRPTITIRAPRIRTILPSIDNDFGTWASTSVNSSSKMAPTSYRPLHIYPASNISR